MNTGIPTLHKNRIYRSRLEARWAQFFDLLGWKYEYEPFDLPGWIPDFILCGKHEEILVEIKPFLRLDQFDTGKIISALKGTDWWGKEILLLGASLGEPGSCFSNEWSGHSTVSVGWLADFYNGYGDFEVAPMTDGPGFTHNLNSYHDRITGKRYKEWDTIRKQYAEHLWAEAGNAVQWRRPVGVR